MKQLVVQFFLLHNLVLIAVSFRRLAAEDEGSEETYWQTRAAFNEGHWDSQQPHRSRDCVGTIKKGYTINLSPLAVTNSLPRWGYSYSLTAYRGSLSPEGLWRTLSVIVYSWSAFGKITCTAQCSFFIIKYTFHNTKIKLRRFCRQLSKCR